ncbi:MAG: HlyD family secretion protein [Hyphomicrobium sp.]
MRTNYLMAAAGAIVLGGLGYLFFGGNGTSLPEDIAWGNGRIEAVQVDVATKIAGRVESVSVREGDLVRQGDVLAQIDVAQLKAQALKAEADIASAQSQAAAAEAAISQAQAQLLLADQELARSSSLVDKGHTSKEVYDTRVSQSAVAKANVASAEAMLVSRQRSIDAARAVAKEIQTEIDDCTLRSPTVGRVLYRLAEPGEVVGAGGKILTLVDLSDVYMEVFLPAAQAHRVNVGAEARIKLDVIDVAIPATVSFVSPESQFTPKQVETASEREKLVFRVKVRVPSELVMNYIERVKTGVRGVAYVRLSLPPGVEPSPWPDFLQKLPPSHPPAAAEPASDAGSASSPGRP